MTITPRATTATSSQAQFFNYASAANPLQQGLISTIPYRSFSANFFDEAGTALQPLDLSADLHCEGPATGPFGWIRGPCEPMRMRPVSCFSWPEAMGKPKPVARFFIGVKAIHSCFRLAVKPSTAARPAQVSTGCTMPPCFVIWA